MAKIRGPRDLCTLDEVKRFLPNYVEPTDSAEKTRADTLLGDLVKSASQRIANVSGREFVSALDPGDTTDTGGTVWPDAPIETRQVDVILNVQAPGGGSARELVVGDMHDVTGLTRSVLFSSGTTTIDLPTAVVTMPRSRGPWQPIRRLRILGGVGSDEVYAITGRWGFPVVPDDIRMAAAEQAAIWAGRDLARFSQTFLEAAAAGIGAREPRSLAQSVYDTAFLYRIPTIT